MIRAAGAGAGRVRGATILLHDGGGPREETVTALEQLVPWLADQGYRFGFPVP